MVDFVSMKRIKVYTFAQTTPADVWDVPHNLNCYPGVDVLIDYQGDLIKVIPQNIENIDENNVRITFSSAYTGTVRCA